MFVHASSCCLEIRMRRVPSATYGVRKLPTLDRGDESLEHYRNVNRAKVC